MSEEMSNSNSVLVSGFEMGVVAVPLHRVDFRCDLLSVSVVVGVRLSLPVAGVSFILGNDFAGGNVWKSMERLPEVVPVPLMSDAPDECAQKYPDAFPACVVTRAVK